MEKQDFGVKLIEARKAKGLTQEEVAEKCQVSVRTIQRIETGTVMPRSFTIKVIAEALGFDFYESSNTVSEHSEKDQNSNLKGHTLLWYIKDLFNLKTHAMKKVTILASLCLTIGFTLFLFGLETNAQSVKENEVISYTETDNHQSFLKTNGRIQVAFTNEMTFENLIAIKNDLNHIGITINYKKLAFDEKNQLSSIKGEVDCNDGFKGRFSIDDLASVNKEKRVGFYRDYSDNSDSSFGTGVLNKIIVLDVGHGGKDSGIVINEFKEKDIVLKIANKIKERYKNSKIDVVLSRNIDVFVPLKNRVDYINSLNPEYVISLHLGLSTNKREKGFDFYVNAESKHKGESNELAIKFKESLRTEVLTNEIEVANLYLLKNVNCPATLIGMGNLSNSNDRKLLTSEKGQSQIAKAIIESIK